MVPTHRQVLREERARRDRHCQSTPRVEATHPDCGIFPLAVRDQEVGQRVCSTVSKNTDAQRHRQSGIHESGRAMETQVDVDKVEPHNLEDKVLAFIRNNTSGAAPTDIGNTAPGQTPAPGLGNCNQSTTSSSHGGSDSYPDLNYFEHAAQWGQDWNTGDADSSGCSNGDLYGLQKGKGKAKVEVSTTSATTVECQVIRPSSALHKVEKQKERERRETAKFGMTAKVGQPERDGQAVKVGTLQAKVGLEAV